MAKTTEDIIARVLSGDVDAFGEIVREYQREIWQIVAYTMRDAATTEDLVQQVFVDAYFHLRQYEPGRDFGRWLRTVARNLVRKELRRGARESRKLRVYRERLLERLENSPGDDERQTEVREALEKCREGLAPDAAQALELRYENARSFDEIAATLGRTVAACRQLLQRVRLGLRRCVEERLSQT